MKTYSEIYVNILADKIINSLTLVNALKDAIENISQVRPVTYLRKDYLISYLKGYDSDTGMLAYYEIYLHNDFLYKGCKLQVAHYIRDNRLNHSDYEVRKKYIYVGG